MQNAHLRFGSLEFVKTTKETQTRIRIRLDRCVAEPRKDGDCQAHLISVFGSDAEIGAIWAALADQAHFTVEGPGLPSMSTTVGQDAEIFRGTLSILGRQRPLRHLVAVSEQMAQSRPGADPNGKRTILLAGEPDFLLYRLSQRFGLPVLPEWAPWFRQELERRKAIQPLVGVGCSPLVVYGSRARFLSMLARGLRRREIMIAEKNGPIVWKRITSPLFPPDPIAQHQ